MKSTAKKSYTMGEIARICQVTPTTVYRWIMGGKIPSFKTAGGHNRVWEEDALKLYKSLNISGSSLGGKSFSFRVLIIDERISDRKHIRRTIQTIFPKAILEEATDCYEAGFKTRDQKPSLVILDSTSANIDGIRACRMIKENKDLIQTKVLLFTNSSSSKLRKDFIKAGADALIGIPFNNDELVNKIKSLISN